MEKTAERLLLFGGLLYLLMQDRGVHYAPPVTTTPTLPPNAGTGLTQNQINQMAIGASTPIQAQANQTINQEIVQQNQAINVAGSIATTTISTLLATHVLTAAVAGPIGAAIAAAILVVKMLISDTHLYANELVTKYENPFGQRFIDVIQEVTNQLNAHTLTQSDVVSAYQGLQGAWQSYEATMHQLQGSNSDWYIVATQSLNNLDNQYMGVTLPNGKHLTAGMGGQYGDTPDYGFVSSWLDWLEGLLKDPDVIMDISGSPVSA